MTPFVLPFLPLEKRKPAMWPFVVALLVSALALAWFAQDREELRRRIAALEAHAVHADDARMTWAAVAEQALRLAEYNEGRCAWSFLPANDRDGIRDAVMIGCSRSDPCVVSWAPEDAP